MKQLKKIKILSRKSDLAIIQANQVGLRIKEKFPNIDIEYITKKTAGDIDLKNSLMIEYIYSLLVLLFSSFFTNHRRSDKFLLLFFIYMG